MSRARARSAWLAVALLLGTAAPLAQGQIYKCTGADGKTAYSDVPCARGSKPLAIPNDAPTVPVGSSVCAQMKDELDRLAAAEAHRKTPSQRRSALYRQYSARCVGISRAPPASR